MLLQPLFHAWERRLASVTTDRVVRPFDWGLDWIPSNGHQPGAREADIVGEWIASVMSDTDAFFTPPPTRDYHVITGPEDTRLLTFPSALATPHVDNNTVHCRFFPANEKGQRKRSRRAAVLVLPQWNADPGGHVGLCR